MSPATISTRRVERVFHRVSLNDGHTMSLVVCDDKSCGIEFDGKLIPALSWPRDEIAVCVDVFENFVFMHGGAKN